MSHKNIIETVNEIANHARLNCIAHLHTEDTKLEENIITVNGKPTVHFGSCSYLGLEFNTKIKEAAKNAIDNYGTQFSSSRAYLSPIYYKSLEEKLEKIFDAPTIVAPTTTLGHIAAIPVLVSAEDVVILDHQVHNSVQTATGLVKSKGTRVELLRHNRIDLLEKRIIELRNKYEKIWYMADGIYSMYGDTTPIDEIHKLLDKYPEFHFYVDDAHAMSCFGKNGRGFVLSEHSIHKRMVVATSLNKAFASGGGALIFHDRKTAQLVKNVGGPLITSGPMQPAALGAANATADIHLSDEITIMQEDLQENIKYADMMLKKHGLPNLSNSFSPIFFIAVSLPKVAYSIINKMKKDGFFLNIGIFPAVPIKNTGVRFTITRLHTFKQIDEMIQAMAKNFKSTLIEENVNLDTIYKAFKIKSPLIRETDNKVDSFIKQSKLTIEHYRTIHHVDPIIWNSILGQNGAFDWNALTVLEESFSNNEAKFENWGFDYLIIKDDNQKPILGTFLTSSISKDDLLANKDVSREIENKRFDNPYFMSSKTLLVGSQLTEGNHLYIDRDSSFIKEALEILFAKISKIQIRENISTTMIRDMDATDSVIDSVMMDNGFFKMSVPDNYKVENVNWKSETEFYKNLTKNSKRHYRKFITKHEHKYDLNIIEKPSIEELNHFYELYLNIQQKSLTISTFTLPFKLFKNMALNENWEVLSLNLRKEYDDRLNNKPVAMAFCYKGNNDYSAVIAGIDYEFNSTDFSYRQLLAKVIFRGRALSKKNIALGYTSGIEKKHFGATEIKSCAYTQIKDNFKMEALAIMTTDKKTTNGTNERRVLSI